MERFGLEDWNGFPAFPIAWVGLEKTPSPPSPGQRHLPPSQTAPGTLPGTRQPQILWEFHPRAESPPISTHSPCPAPPSLSLCSSPGVPQAQDVPRGNLGLASPVSQSQSRQLLSAEPVRTCLVSPGPPVREYQPQIHGLEFLRQVKKGILGQNPPQERQCRGQVFPLQHPIIFP